MTTQGPTIRDLTALLPGSEGRLALSYVLDRSPGWLAAHGNLRLEGADLQAYLEIVDKRKAGLPLQYAIGRWDFYGRTFLCDPRALIPRPETERLVELALAKGISGAIADVGTGTGCLILTLALELGPGNSYFATDLSSEALDLARENERRLLGTAAPPAAAAMPPESSGGPAPSMVQWRQGNLLDPLEGPLDWVLSNPPYVGETEREDLQAELAWEPDMALFAGPEGLDLYPALAQGAADKLRPGGQILFEIGDRQGQAVRQILARTGFQEITVEKDYAGRDRLVSARWGEKDV